MRNKKAKAFLPLNYTKCAVIVHGKSEKILCQYIKSQLHIKMEIISRGKGSSSIQINGLEAMLKKKPYASLRQFADEFTVEYDSAAKALLNFKLFIIMDTDDCTLKMKERYTSGELFSSSPLKDYIVPIYNIPNLENALAKAGILARKISSSEKSEVYSKIFPINEGPLTEDVIQEVRLFSEKVSGHRETNMDVFVDYCLGIISQVTP